MIATPQATITVKPAVSAATEIVKAEAKLNLRDVDVRYGSFLAVRTSRSTWPNAVTAIIGPSGTGKSTLSASLNRMNDLVQRV